MAMMQTHPCLLCCGNSFLGSIGFIFMFLSVEKVDRNRLSEQVDA